MTLARRPDPAGGPERRTGPLARLGLLAGPLAFLALVAGGGGALSAAEARVAGVTAWTAIWWITQALPIGVTSLLPAVLFPLLGVLGAKEVAPLYMQDLVLLFVGAFIVSLGLERWNVHRRMALAIVAKVGSDPRRLVLGFMVAAAFLSLWINNTSTTLLMLPIAMAVAGGMPPAGRAGEGGAFAIALLLGVAYSASVGGIGTPVGTAPNQVFLGHLRTMFPAGPELSFGTWTLAWLPLVALYLPLAWWLLTRVALRVPARLGGRESAAAAARAIAAERAALGPMGAAERRMAGLFVLTALLWVTRGGIVFGSLAIPGWVRLFDLPEPERAVTDATVALAMAVLAFLVPAGGGKGALMDWEHAKRLPWEVLLLIGGGFALAGGFAASGLDRTLGASVAGWIDGAPPVLVTLAVVLFVTLLTEVTSNTATTAVLVPILGRAAVAAGLDPLVTMAPATVAASCAFMLPVATPPNAVVFASGRVPAPTMARVGLWTNTLLVLLVTLVFQLWSGRVLGVSAGVPAWATAPGAGAAAPQGVGPDAR